MTICNSYHSLVSPDSFAGCLLHGSLFQKGTDQSCIYIYMYIIVHIYIYIRVCIYIYTHTVYVLDIYTI